MNRIVNTPARAVGAVEESESLFEIVVPDFRLAISDLLPAM